MYKISVITEDDFEVTFECPPSQDIIAAGVSSDVILLSSCHEGGCATCKAECLEGDYELGRCSVQALPPDEEEASTVLLCRTYPRSDLVIRVPYMFERIAFQKINTEWRGEIVVVEKISSNVAKLQIELKDPETGAATQLPFLAGQYLDIEIPGTDATRCYSMASIDDDPYLDFLIRILPGGRFSQFLSSEAKPGVVMKLRGPFGGFNIRENGLRARYFVAGGTGLAPVLSMIRYMKREQHPQEAKLFFGVTHQHEVFYLDELQKLESEMPNLRVYVTVMKPEADWQGCTGTVVDELTKQLQEAKAKPDIYLCGPPAMIDATFAAAATCGVPREQVYVEKFLASGQAVAAE
ncbi:MAG: aromatic/alkene monooxygenase hydroxylase FAD-binding subunit MmoC [Methylovirgula sp.]